MIEISNLNLTYKNQKILKNINLKSEKNLGIIGQSGAGKSSFLKALIRLFDENYSLNAKNLRVLNCDVLNLNAKNLQIFRQRVALIFQDARASLYPFFDIGELFILCAKTRQKLNKKQIKEKAFFHFSKLNLKNADKIWHSYPHQLSVGEAMRVQLALVLSCECELLLLDEPTGSLDEKNALFLQEILLNLDKKLIIISHDLNLIKNISEEIIFLENGKLLEFNKTKDFFEKPKNKSALEFLEIFKENSC